MIPEIYNNFGKLVNKQWETPLPQPYKGGDGFNQIPKFSHANVQFIEFSPCKEYLVPFCPSSVNMTQDPSAIITNSVTPPAPPITRKETFEASKQKGDKSQSKSDSRNPPSSHRPDAKESSSSSFSSSETKSSSSSKSSSSKSSSKEEKENTTVKTDNMTTFHNLSEKPLQLSKVLFKSDLVRVCQVDSLSKAEYDDLASEIGTSMTDVASLSDRPLKVCTTLYEGECTTVHERKCTTTREKQCSTSYDLTCSTSYMQECTTSHEEECFTNYDRECPTSYEQKCPTSYKQQCSTSCERECPITYEAECSGYE